MRYQTSLSVSPAVGIVNCPPVAPLVSAMKGCAWVWWWKSTRQVKEPAGRGPSSGSEPVPPYTITSPAVYVVPAGGFTKVATGGWLEVTLRVAAALVADPNPLLTTQRNGAPSSESCAFARV